MIKKMLLFMACIAICTPAIPQGLSNGRGITLAFLATSAFANLPSAAGNSGIIYNLTDFPTPVFVISDGISWEPLNGEAQLYASGKSQTALTGTVTESNIIVKSIPAALLSANDSIIVETLWTYTGTNGAKTFVVRASSTSGDVATGSVFQSSGSGSTAGAGQVLTFIRNNNSTSAQIGYANATSTSFGSTGSAASTGTINTANAWYVNLNGIVAGSADTLTLASYSIKWRRGGVNG